MARGPSGHIEQLPSGAWRAKVYAGVDPLTRREIRLRETCRTERAAQITLGKLLEQAAVGRQPDSNVTVATLLDEYAAIAEWELPTREANEGYIRRTIKTAQTNEGQDHPEHPQHPFRAFATAKRWGWIDLDPAESAKPPTVTQRPRPATAPEDVAAVIAEGRKTHPAMALCLWLVAITGARRGEICALQVRDIDLERGSIHIAFNYLVKNGQRVRKDTKTHQDRYLAIDPVTCAMIRDHLDAIRASLTDFGLNLPAHAYISSNDPQGANPWNPDCATHKAGELALAAGVKVNIKGGGCGPAGRPRPAERRVSARGRAGLLHQPAAGRGAG